MKKLLTLLFLSFGLVTFGQVYQLMPQYGYQASRFRFDSTLQIPTVCGVPTLKSNVTRLGAIAFDSCNNRFYTYNPKTATWSQVSGGGGSTDTTSLSNRINLKLDSVKRRSDSVFAYRNGTEVFQFRDSVKYDTSTVVVMTVVNATGTTLLKGEAVYLFGATGSTASVKRANNKSDTTSSKTIGIVRRDIAAGGTGTVTTQGQVEKLNLGAYAEGDILYLDSVDGRLTKVKPVAPYHQVFVGVVERANNGNGLMYIKPQNGYELGELHNVSVNNERQNAVFYFDSTNRVWKAQSAYNLVDTTKLSARIDQRVRRSLIANDTIKTNGKEFYLNATGTTRNTTFRIDTVGITVDVNSGLNSSDFLISPSYNSFSQIFGINANYLTMQPSGGVDISAANASTTDGFNTTAAVGSFWYVDAYDTIGIFPRTDGTSGQILKLGDGAQLVWANDETGSVDTTSLSNRINQRVRYTDTASMLTPYLRKTDTASLSNRINTKLNITDTSVFQRKELPAYSFVANGTSAAANSVATYYKDTSGTYTGNIAWSATTQPSGATTHSYRWTRIGKMVTLNIELVYATNGGAVTALTIDLPSDCPTPSEPNGLDAASENMYPANVHTSTSTNALTETRSRGFLRNNPSNNGYEIIANFISHSANSAYITLNYWTN